MCPDAVGDGLSKLQRSSRRRQGRRVGGLKFTPTDVLPLGQICLRWAMGVEKSQVFLIFFKKNVFNKFDSVLFDGQSLKMFTTLVIFIFEISAYPGIVYQ